MSKVESDSLHKLDINWLCREKMLQKNCWNNRNITWTHQLSGHQSSITIYASLTEEDRSVRLIYTVTDRFSDSKEDIDYVVRLTSTPCFFGGVRYWFTCPLSQNGIYCGRRVSKLYFLNKYFGCRHCHNLTYECKNFSGLWKTVGTVISNPDLTEQRQKLKRKYYKGKITKKYRKILKDEDKSLRQLIIVSKGLNAEL
jgi:hypothetical protein